MPQTQPISFQPAVSAQRQAWRFSWPLVMGLLTYAYLLAHGSIMLRDSDTYWHIAAGRWILDHGAVPDAEAFSHTMRGAPWLAFEWLSEVIFAWTHRWGGLSGLVALSALAFAWAIALLTRELLKWLEPIHALLFSFLALFMAAGHALARPHLLATPLMMIWTIGLVHAVEEDRAPSWWLLPVMTIWANLHAGFTFGLLLAGAFALEALVGARGQRAAIRQKFGAWGLFLLLALACSMLTPHGPRTLWFTWEVLVTSDYDYALQVVGEWRSPNFQNLQPLELWLIGGLAVVLQQGIRLPAVRLAILLGLVHLALKHARHIELLGLIAPLVLAAPLGRQWRAREQGKPQAAVLDQLFLKLALPSGPGAWLLAAAMFVALPAWMAETRPATPPEDVAPTRALQAAQAAGLHGPVFNEYSFGGWLAYNGIPVFIDGRVDTYGDSFLKAYVEATQLARSDSFDKIASQYGIEWTLLAPGTPVIALLDALPGWKRIYADEAAVIHVRQPGATGTKSQP